MISRRLAPVVLLFAIVTLVACNEEDEDAAPTSTTSPPGASIGSVLAQPHPSQPLEAEVTRAEGGVVQITASGAQFSGNNIAIKLGEPVTIRVTNEDMESHRLRIAGFDGQYDTEDDVVSATLTQRDTDELNFAPAVAGSYTFRCDFHPGSMGGRISANEEALPEPIPQTAPPSPGAESPAAEPTP